MKICLLADTFPSVSETWIANEAEWLAAQGHEVVIAARIIQLDKPAPPGVRLLPVRVPTRPLHLLLEALQLALKSRAHREVFRGEGGFIESLRRMHRFQPFIHYVPDVFHAHFGNIGAGYAFLRKALNRPFVVTFHGYDLRRGLRDNGRRYADLFRKADAIIAISEYSRTQLLRMGCPERSLHVIPLGIDPARFHPLEKQPDKKNVCLITVARLAREKNLELALRAVAEARKALPQLTLHYRIIGDGPARRDLEDVAQSLGLSDVWAGTKEPAAIARELRAADLFLLSSIEEVAPVAILEAMASGLPVIATRVGAIPELITPETGLLVDSGDLPGMSAALQKLCQDHALRTTLGAAARERILQHYDATPLQQQLLQTLEIGAGR